MSAITGVSPQWALPGARIRLTGSNLRTSVAGWPHVRVGSQEARVVAASPDAIRVVVPSDTPGGVLPITVDEVPGQSTTATIGRLCTSGVHQVDSPVFDRAGRLYVTESAARNTRLPIPLFRITPDDAREPIAVDLPNATSLACGPDGLLYVSSRFDGQVFRLTPDDRAELYATELGVATGLAFAPDGTLFVGDRSGSILRISPDRQVDTFATVPSSIAAFHLAYGPDDCLYVTAPTLATRDVVYRVTPDRLVDVACEGFGRPQGLAFSSTGDLYVVDALAGAAGLYRVNVRVPSPTPELVVSAAALVGVAIDPMGGLVLASNDTVWRLDVPLVPWSR